MSEAIYFYFGFPMILGVPISIAMFDRGYTGLHIISVLVLWPIAVPLILFVQLKEVLRSMIP